MKHIEKGTCAGDINNGWLLDSKNVIPKRIKILSSQDHPKR